MVSTWRTTQQYPLTSPPITAENINLADLAAPVLYIRLHGICGQPYLYGAPGWGTTLSLDKVKAADFTNSLLFLEGCYGAAFADAFLSAGAKAVIGSSQPTWGRKYLLGPSSIIGRDWLRNINAQQTVKQALESALKKVSHPHNQSWIVQGDLEATL
jgi:hypothetical protein